MKQKTKENITFAAMTAVGATVATANPAVGVVAAAGVLAAGTAADWAIDKIKGKSDR